MKPSKLTLTEANERNMAFESEVSSFLSAWMIRQNKPEILTSHSQSRSYLGYGALRDFFSISGNPMGELLDVDSIFNHLNRAEHLVYFDPISSDPLFSRAEQRIYNLARRLDKAEINIPFRSVQVNKQTEFGDIAEICTYPSDSEELRYNSGNHFASRPANGNVFVQNSEHCKLKSDRNLHILYKIGFLEDRLQEIRSFNHTSDNKGHNQPVFFVICSRHSINEGHFGTSLVVMDPHLPEIPRRILVCDTLLKQLPHHPRWWHHFLSAYSNVFGYAVNEFIEDLSHPLQKVNVKGDDPFRHDWDCPYYAAALANALSELVITNPELLLYGSTSEVHQSMCQFMPEYYYSTGEIKPRSEIQISNRKKRWNSGQQLINGLKTGRYHSLVKNNQ